MFTVSSKIKRNILKEVNRVEEKFDNDPFNELYHSQIHGLLKAYDIVVDTEDKEYMLLGKWGDEREAENKKGEDNAINTRELSRG